MSTSTRLRGLSTSRPSPRLVPTEPTRRYAPFDKADALRADLYASIYGGARTNPIEAAAVPRIIAQAFGGEISARYKAHDLVKAGVPPERKEG